MASFPSCMLRSFGFVFLSMLLAGPALAGSPEYNPSPGSGNASFATKYPTYYAANGCGSCHITTSPAVLNLYGTSYKTELTRVNGTLRPPPQAGVGPALVSAETKDPDGDGYANIAEINNGFLAHDASSHPSASASMSSTQSAKSGNPSTTVSYSVTLTNTGNIADSFTLAVSVTSGQTWTPSIVGSAANVSAGGSATFTVNVAIAPGATQGQSSVARITAVSQANATISALPLSLTTTYPVPVPRYVNAATGSDTTTCAAAGTPCKTITYAMTQAFSSNPGDSINVAPGTYNVALGEVFPISIASGVQLLATGTAAATIVDATGANARVFNASGSNAATVIQGFHIKGGLHQTTDFTNAQGGAIYIDNFSAIAVRRNLISGNEARGYAGTVPPHGQGGDAYGGAIATSNSSPRIENNVFRGNIARGGNGVTKSDGTTGGTGGSPHGGTLYIGGGASTVVINNTFHGNSAIAGAGGNSNATGGSGGNAFNGAFEYNSAASGVSLVNNIFSNNSAVAGAGGTGTTAGGSGVAFAGATTVVSSLSFTNNLFSGNTPSNGDTGASPVLAGPQFHGAPSDLHISLASPAKAPAGTAAGAPTLDFDSKTRPSPPSIGAFEATAYPSTTSVISSLNPSGVGQSVTFTATVSGTNGALSGSAVFKDGTTTVCGATIVLANQASCTTSTLTQGTHSITAEYSGDAAYAASASTPLSQVVQPPGTFILTLTKTGTGAGTVTSSPAGINCGATCTAGFNSGAAVTLTAVASAGSTFGGWSGAGCTGAGGCTVTLNAATTVAASFTSTAAVQCAGDDDKDGIPNCVELAEGRNPLVKDNDVLGSARLFAMQQYRDFLNREGDATGIAYWTNQVSTGAKTRGQCVENFFTSAEFQSTVAPVVRLYFAYFLRIPDYDGLQFWVDYYKAGHSLDDISNAFAGSPEFSAQYGALTNSQYVNLVYQNVLGRAGDAVGIAFWTNELNTGSRTRGNVMLGFSESPEYQGTSFVKVYVTMMYVGMLRRAPEQAGFDFWSGYMNGGNSGLALINGFLAAAEYRNRFIP